VHVGQDDLPAAAARRQLGDAAIVGVSTHNDAQLIDGIAMPVELPGDRPGVCDVHEGASDPVVGLAGVSAARRRVAGDGRRTCRDWRDDARHGRSVVDAAPMPSR
jgi:thiamine-phosphate pyrophosphorylase